MLTSHTISRPRQRRVNRFRPLLTTMVLLIVGAVLVPGVQARSEVRPLRQQGQRAIDPQLAAALNRVLDQTIANRSTPGVVRAVTLPGYQTWRAARGVADRHTGLAMDPRYKVRVASVTKLFVATVVLQLVEEQRLALDAPVVQWLPALVPSAPTLTIRHLLNHTSGLWDYLDGPFLQRVQRDPQRRWTPRALVDYALRHPPHFAPGARGRWHYSNTNYVLLGLLVEQVTKRSLAHEIRWRVLDRVGLRQTVVAPDEAVPGRLVHGYAGTKDLTHLNLSYAWASGNIVSTVDDLGRFVRALFGGRLLQPATLARMYSWIDTRHALGVPELSYGLGVMRHRLPVRHDSQGGQRPAAASVVLGHIGNLGGYRSAVWYVPASGITIALSLNQGGVSPVPLTTRVLEVILNHQSRQASQ